MKSRPYSKNPQQVPPLVYPSTRPNMKPAACPNAPTVIPSVTTTSGIMAAQLPLPGLPLISPRREKNPRGESSTITLLNHAVRPPRAPHNSIEFNGDLSPTLKPAAKENVRGSGEVEILEVLNRTTTPEALLVEKPTAIRKAQRHGMKIPTSLPSRFLRSTALSSNLMEIQEELVAEPLLPSPKHTPTANNKNSSPLKSSQVEEDPSCLEAPLIATLPLQPTSTSKRRSTRKFSGDDR